MTKPVVAYIAGFHRPRGQDDGPRARIVSGARPARPRGEGGRRSRPWGVVALLRRRRRSLVRSSRDNVTA